MSDLFSRAADKSAESKRETARIAPQILAGAMWLNGHKCLVCGAFGMFGYGEIRQREKMRWYCFAHRDEGAK